jgi:uncharacterized protein
MEAVMKPSLPIKRRPSLLLTLVMSAALVWSGIAQAETKATAKASTNAKDELPHLKWADLVPAGWDPAAEVRKRIKDPNFDNINDADPRMLKMLKEMREIWDTAPTNAAMDGVRGRIPGFLVPLEESKQGIKELLLVPYYGACIHSPPPPANQIIHVVLDKPVKGYMTMDTVWVSGTLRALRGNSYMGASGYKIDQGQLESYVQRQKQSSP